MFQIAGLDFLSNPLPRRLSGLVRQREPRPSVVTLKGGRAGSREPSGVGGTKAIMRDPFRKTPGRASGSSRNVRHEKPRNAAAGLAGTPLNLRRSIGGQWAEGRL